jgi:hypothetical protein
VTLASTELKAQLRKDVNVTSYELIGLRQEIMVINSFRAKVGHLNIITAALIAVVFKCPALKG